MDDCDVFSVVGCVVDGAWGVSGFLRESTFWLRLKSYSWTISGVMVSLVNLSSATVGLQRNGGSGLVGLPGLM